MSKPKMLGYYKPYVPNSKADRKRTKPFGTHQSRACVEKKRAEAAK